MCCCSQRSRRCSLRRLLSSTDSTCSPCASTPCSAFSIASSSSCAAVSWSVSQSNKYLKTGQGTRRPAGLAAGGERPRWLRGLERYFGWAEGGAWPEQNRRWMERERTRRVRRKLPSTPHTKKRKPGQAPAGPASAGPAGRTRARARADNGWECHVEIEWVEAQWLTPHCGGLSAGRGRRRSRR